MKSFALSPGINSPSQQLESSPLAMMRACRDLYRAWCEQCCDVVNALTPESAVTLVRITPARVCSLLESGSWHTVELGGKSQLICCKSISSNSRNSTALA